MRGALILAFLALASCAPAAKPKIQPSNKEMLAMRQQMAEELVEQRDFTNAAPLLRDLVRERPRDARMHLLLGIVLREKGAYQAAEKEMLLSKQLEPRSPDVHTALGVLLLKSGRHQEAEQEHRKAVSLAPQVARYHNDLGFCLLVQRRMDEAKGALMEAIRLDPNLRVAFNNLGFVLGLAGDMEGALRAFSQAGDRAMALTNMGYVEELRGRPEHARRYYERAVQHRRDYKPALHNLRVLDPGRWGGASAEGTDLRGGNERPEDADKLETNEKSDGDAGADRRGRGPAAGRGKPERLHQGGAPGVIDR